MRNAEWGMWNRRGRSSGKRLTVTFRISHSAFRILARLIPMIALARKYRPKQFADLIVQTHVAAALRGAVAAGRVAPGYSFAGPSGVGERSPARLPASRVVL